MLLMIENATVIMISTQDSGLVKAIALMSLSLLALLLASPSARADYPGGGYPGGYPGGGYPGSGGWVPSDSHGTPLTPGMQGTNSDGSANLLPTTGKSPKKTNTYPIQDGDPAWWFGAYSPNNGGTGDPYYYYYNGLFLSSTANNTTRDNYGALAASYDLNNYNFDRADNLTLPPDLTGSVHADNTDTLTAYFVWTGDPSHIPAHQDFLLRTSLSATAGVNFGNGGATSGLSATGEGMLEGDTVTATAGDAGNDHPAPHTKAVLVRATPNGNLITLSRSAGVSVDTSNSLPYSTWVDSPALANASGPGTYYYNGPPSNGQTSASASASASATANTDSRDVIIQSNLGQTYYKGINALPQPNMRQPDGTMTDDTAVYNSPGSGNFGVLVNYQAVTIGSWAVNSSYAWSNTATQWVTTPATQLHGTFNPDPITPLQVDYFKTSSSVPGSPGTTDNVRVLLTEPESWVEIIMTVAFSIISSISARKSEYNLMSTCLPHLAAN